MSKFIKEVAKQSSELLQNGVFLLASLAWNDVVKSAITEYYPLALDSLQAKVIYAVVATVFAVVFIYFFKRFFGIGDSPVEFKEIDNGDQEEQNQIKEDYY